MFYSSVSSNNETRNPDRHIKKTSAAGRRNRILIVEDEIVARTRLQAILERSSGYRITAVATAAAALETLQTQPVDIVLLDIQLPDAGDFELASLIGHRIDIGLIIISSCDDADSRLQGLRCGADDYLSKPYHGEELALRVARLARRIHETRSYQKPVVRRMRFGPWICDPDTMLLCHAAGRKVKISSREKQLLTLFLKYPGRVFSRQQLLDALYPDGGMSVFDRAIDSAIARLRRRIETDPKSPDILKTIYGEGYLFDASVQSLDH